MSSRQGHLVPPTRCLPGLWSLLLLLPLPAASESLESALGLQTPLSLLSGAQAPPPDFAARGWNVTAAVQWTNWWSEFEPGGTRLALIDFEGASTRVSLAGPISRRVSAGFAFSERRHFGGTLDDPILRFHRLLGLDTEGRELVERNRTHLELTPGDGRPDAILSGLAAGRYDRSAAGGLGLTFRQHEAFSVRVGLSLAKHWSEARLIERRGLDVGAFVELGYRERSSSLSTRFGIMHASAVRIGPLAARRWQPRLSARALFELGRNSGLVLGYRVAEGPLSDLGAWSRPSHELLIAVQRDVRGATWEVGVVENLLNFSNGPDFGFHLAVRRPFGSRTLIP